jgi:hypothetical protein
MCGVRSDSSLACWGEMWPGRPEYRYQRR